jgi:hypothetical protein
MSKFQLFDSVKLTKDILLTDGGIAPIHTVGSIVEVLKNGEAYLVELFGDWVKYDEQGNFVSATQTDKGEFMETIGVEIVYPHQLVLAIPGKETMKVVA